MQQSSNFESVANCRTPSPARDPSPAPAAAPALEPKVEEVKELPREVVEGRAKLLAKEYLSNADVKELLLSLQVPSVVKLLPFSGPCLWCVWQKFRVHVGISLCIAHL